MSNHLKTVDNRYTICQIGLISKEVKQYCKEESHSVKLPVRYISTLKERYTTFKVVVAIFILNLAVNNSTNPVSIQSYNLSQTLYSRRKSTYI